MRDVGGWLEELGLEEYVPLFEKQRIDLEVLSDLSEADLRELDIPLGHRKKLLRAIAAIDSVGRARLPTGTDAPASSPVEAARTAERRQLTIMFCDLVGSTELAGRLDPEDLRTLINRYQEACRAAIARYGGFIARYMGDGVLVYFGYPKSHEGDAERAVLAGLALVDAVRALHEETQPHPEAALAVRVGVATGLVVVGDLIGEGASRESPVVGETPNIAARLQGLAEPNTIVIAQATRQLLGEAFEYRALGPQSLKGVAEPVEAWQVTGQRSVESRFEAAGGIGLTPLVGRDEEIGLLLRRWERAEAGEGQVVVVSGEVGIGKSRLTDEIRRALAERPHARVGFQCLEHHQNSAFHPLIAQLERTAGILPQHGPAEKLTLLESHLGRTGDIEPEDVSLFAELLSIPTNGRFPGPRVEPAQRRRQIQSALLRRLETIAAQDPVLCIFEDAHWIDPSTLELLEKIVDRASALPVLVIVTSRPEFAPSWTGQPHTSLLALNRMDRRQSRAIVEEIVATYALPETVVAQIVAKTDGIPLFIEELTRAMLDSGARAALDAASLGTEAPGSTDIPTTLQDSLMARLDRLSVGKPVAQVAAALGREFSHDLITAVCDREAGELEDALGELIDSGLIFRRGTGDQSAYVFKHALIKDAAYQSMLRSARKSLHHRIASTLCGQFPEIAELQPESVARHFSEAGEIAQAIAYWKRAGERAAARAAHAEAIGHYSQATLLVERIEDGQQRASAEIDCNLGLAASMRVVDSLDEALAALDRAEEVARGLDRTAALAEIHYLRGNVYFPMGRIEECLTEHQRSRDMARRAGLLESEARALGGMGDGYYQRGRLITADDHYRDCIDICQKHGFLTIEAAYLPMRGITNMYQLRFPDALRFARAGVERAIEAQNLRAEAVSWQVSSYLMIDMDDFDGAREASERAIDVCRQLGAGNLGASAKSHYGRLLSLMGQREEGLAVLREAYAEAAESGLNFVGPSILGYLALATDDSEERSRALRMGEQLLEDHSVSHNYLRFYRFAMEANLRSGNWDEVDRFASVLEAYTRPEPFPWADFLVERGRALATFGRGERGASCVATLRRLRERALSHDFAYAVHAVDAALAEVP